jgi:ferredoxin
MLLDLYSYAAPRLAVVDGVVAMEGNGPAHGFPRKLDLILASTDSVALDVVASELVGYRFEDVPTNLAAVKRGLVGELQDLEIVGEDLDEIRVSDFAKPITRGPARRVPSFLKHLLKDISSPKPVSNGSRCTLCRVCVDNCPSQAMRVAKERVLVDYQECIRCYCCHELCPEGAIELRVHPLARPFVNTGS